MSERSMANIHRMDSYRLKRQIIDATPREKHVYGCTSCGSVAVFVERASVDKIMTWCPECDANTVWATDKNDANLFFMGYCAAIFCIAALVGFLWLLEKFI